MTIPKESWFWMRPPSELHGLGHTARVMTWACVLTQGTQWFEPVVWAAACHDLRRHDDGRDPEHGFRAGRWVWRKLPGLLRRPPAALEWIASACDWHVCSDSRSEWDHPVLWLLKDADGLDRVRLYDLDPRYLRRPEAVALADKARRLYEATALMDDPAAIWQVAVSQELPVEPLLAFVAAQEANLRPASMETP
jgi:hypothetical protein